MQGEIEDMMSSLSAMGPFSGLVRLSVAEAARGGDRIAAQRLWGMLLAATHGHAYGETITDRAASTDKLYDRTAAAEALLCRALASGKVPFAPDLRRPGRFLVCVGFLPPSSRYTSHLHQVCCFAAALAVHPGTEAVLILVTREYMPEGNGLSQLHDADPPDRLAGWQAALAAVISAPDRDKIAFHEVPGVGTIHPIELALGSALAFRPDAALYFLGGVQSHLMPPLMEGICPQIGIQFHVTNNAPGPCDLVLAQGGPADFADKPQPGQWATQKAPVIPLGSLEGPLPALPEVSCRIVTALSLGRIERVLMGDPAVRRLLVGLLDKHPGTDWVLVGTEDADGLAASDADVRRLRDAGRVHLVARIPSLRQLYRACDLYVHLPGLGGGGMGIAMAVAEGLPALIEAGTDAANFIIEGRYATARDLAGDLDALVQDPDQRQALAARQADRMARHHSLAAVAESLMTNIERAARRFMDRTGM